MISNIRGCPDTSKHEARGYNLEVYYKVVHGGDIDVSCVV